MPSPGTAAPGLATANGERSESTAVDTSRYTGVAISPTAAVIRNAIESGRRLTPSTLRATGRAISDRKTNRPIATITDRNIAHRAISRLVSVAVSEMCGIGNCGGGPGVGPTANV